MINRISDFFTKGDERTLKVKKNMLFVFSIKGVSILINLIYVPLLINYLDQDRYGIWVTLVSIVNWIGLVDLGFGNGLKNKLGESLALKKYEQAREQVSTTYFYLALIFTFAFVVFAAVNYFYLDWNHILNISSLPNSELRTLTTIILFSICARFVLQLINVVLTADQKAYFPNLTDTLSNLLSLLIVFFLMYIGEKSIIVFASVMSFVPIVIFVSISLYFFNNKYNFLKPALKFVNNKQIKDIFSLSWKFFLIQVSLLLISCTANFLIMHYLGPSYVTEYDLVSRLFNFIIMPYMVAFQSTFPSYVNAYSLNDFTWIRRNVKIQVLALFVGVLPLIGVAVFAKEIIYFWSKGVVMVDDSLLISLAAVYAFVIIWNNTYGTILGAFSKIRLSTLLTIISATLNIPISIYLLTNGYGVSSVLVGILCSSLLVFILGPIQTYYFVFAKSKNNHLNQIFS